jgi:SAM-dependent methyltransferase
MDRQQEPTPVSPFWTEPGTVDTFANRDPDRRLVEILNNWAGPSAPRVLDVGCAGGRNTVLLAEKNLEFHALDASRPMVVRTRKRVAQIAGVAAARQRVFTGTMEDLSAFPDASFNLVIALGVYHQASSLEGWHNAVSESGRVLTGGGLVLISAFTPESQPDGEPLLPEHDLPDMYEGFSSGSMCLFDAERHDSEMASHGFEPHVPSETVQVKTELGFRVTLNALYRKGQPGSASGSP